MIKHERAFPSDFPNASGMRVGPRFGLTKRELFAAMILQGSMANSIPGSHHVPNESVRDAVERADLLIAELNKEKL